MRRNPLQAPFEDEFTPYQDWACFLGAAFLMFFPITMAVIIIAVLLAFR